MFNNIIIFNLNVNRRTIYRLCSYVKSIRERASLIKCFYMAYLLFSIFYLPIYSSVHNRGINNLIAQSDFKKSCLVGTSEVINKQPVAECQRWLLSEAVNNFMNLAGRAVVGKPSVQDCLSVQEITISLFRAYIKLYTEAHRKMQLQFCIPQ